MAYLTAAIAFQETKKQVKIDILYKWISDREEVVTAVLVCMAASVVLIVMAVTGNSVLVSLIDSSPSLVLYTL